MSLTGLIVYLILLAGAVISYRAGKLTRAGAITGYFVGFSIYKGAGLISLILLAAFFVLGSWATKWQISKKAAIGVAEANKGRRTAGQVLANGGVAAILGLMAWQSQVHIGIVQVMIAGSLASAT